MNISVGKLLYQLDNISNGIGKLSWPPLSLQTSAGKRQGSWSAPALAVAGAALVSHQSRRGGHGASVRSSVWKPPGQAFSFALRKTSLPNGQKPSSSNSTRSGVEPLQKRKRPSEWMPPMEQSSGPRFRRAAGDVETKELPSKPKRRRRRAEHGPRETSDGGRTTAFFPLAATALHCVVRNESRAPPTLDDRRVVKTAHRLPLAVSS